MKKTIKLNYKELENLVSETVHKMISERNSKKKLNESPVDETSRRQKAQQAILGKNDKIKTMCIISAENPMGQKVDAEYNKQAMEQLIGNLKVANYMYFQTKGLYGSPENSVIVYNISLEDTLYLCYKYNQESVIFIEKNGNEINYQYWQGDEHSSKLKLQREVHDIIDANNAEDAWTQISKKFKFRIPFFECAEYVNQIIKENCPDETKADILINECLDDKYTGKHKYVTRFKLYGKQKDRMQL